MALINIKNVSLSFGHPALLENINLAIEQGERVCVVGRNGAGKTTLLKLLTGEVVPDSGDVERRQGMKVAELPQNVPQDLVGTCLEIVTGVAQGTETMQERMLRGQAAISRLELSPSMRVEEMSGGLKRRTLLAKALVDEPDLLLLDEPTNHLDIESITWLETFLVKYRGTLLFITHDRVFLQKLATRIVDIDNGRLTSWPGDYASYLKKKQEALLIEDRGNAKFDKKMAEEEIWIRKGVRDRRTRNEGRVRELMKMRAEANARRDRAGAVNMELQEGGRTAKRVLEAKDVTFNYEGSGVVVKDFSAVVYRGDKIGIIGPNGCGKTTLLRLLLGELNPCRGEIRIGAGVEVSYLDQLRDQLDMNRTVIENVIESGDKVIVNGKPKHIVSYLRDFLFSSERARTPVWVLSGGERNRLLLAKLFTKPANVLVLDEPTNDLDSETLELLEERLHEFRGTVLLVSHDRAFLNNVATGTMVFERNGSIGEYAGGYDDWIKQRVVDNERLPVKQAKLKVKRSKPKSNKPKKLTFKERFELDALPARIEELESEQESLHAKMADPKFYKSEGASVSVVTARLQEVEAELVGAYERWESLETIAEDAGR